mmetsp:Transcript_6439/g.18004  ORF Transcript_6439/g.18004 Transcript_6439/m.18004 type:complete len:121 (+) Transcript_6439:270-632(+)
MMERLKEHRSHNLVDMDPETLGVSFTGMLDNMKINLFIVWNYLMPPDDFTRKRNCRDAVLAVIQAVLIEFKQKGAMYSYTHHMESTLPARSIAGSDLDTFTAAAAAGEFGTAVTFSSRKM